MHKGKIEILLLDAGRCSNMKLSPVRLMRVSKQLITPSVNQFVFCHHLMYCVAKLVVLKRNEEIPINGPMLKNEANLFARELNILNYNCFKQVELIDQGLSRALKHIFVKTYRES